MGRVIESILYRGTTDRTLRISYVFELVLEGKYQNIKENESTGKITTYPSFIITISTMNPQIRFTIGSNKYYTFVVLF
jgi:hypothetical protein